MKNIAIILTLISIIFFTACAPSEKRSTTTVEEIGAATTPPNTAQDNLETTPTAEEANIENGLYAQMNTSEGSIMIKLEFEKTPLTVASFVGLAEGKIENTAKSLGTPYFNGLTFHRVIPGFMIQGGDPLGVGTGGPGYKFKDEIDMSKYPELNHSTPGVISMANSGPATNGSQFFLTVAPTPGLDGKHAVFGKIVDGYDVAVAISKMPRDRRDMPNTPVFINDIKIIRVGEAAETFDAAKVFQELN